MDWIRSKTLRLMLVVLLLAAAGCRQGGRGAERLEEDSEAAENVDTNLIFNNITLEEVNDQGQAMWKVQAAQVVYSPDKKTAQVQSPNGELFQNGKVVYRVEAQRGEVRRDGNRILLRGNVVATDVESGAILRGNQLEWQPQKDLLIVKGNLQGTHPEIQFSANEARASNRQRQIELSGQIEALTQDEPRLRLQGERIVWQMDKEMVISDRPVQVQQLQGDQVTDQANANRAEVNLQTKTARLIENAILTLLDPPLQISGNLLQWNVNQNTLVSEQPITVVHRQEQVTLTANQGRMELEPQVAHFNGNVRATGEQNQSLLTADQLTWQVDSQRVEAEGNVVYVQPNPPATLRGPRAVGKLQDQTIVVSGGRVETQVVPGEDFEILPEGAVN